MKKGKAPTKHSQYLAEKQKEKMDQAQSPATMAPVVPPAMATKKKAIAVVDFENWYYCLKKNFGISPNIEGWLEEILVDDVKDIIFVGDFSDEMLAAEMSRIRVFPVTITDTKNLNPVNEKDYSDMFVVNTLYQAYIKNQEVDKIILVSGDGHFTQTCGFLRHYCKKEVVVYGVIGSISQSLQMAASTVIEMPDNYDYLLPSVKAILEYMRDVKQQKPYWKFYYGNTISHVSDNNDIPYNTIRDAFATMIAQGYITKTEIYEGDAPKTIYEADWNKVYSDELIPAPSSPRRPSLAKSKGDHIQNGYDFTFKAVAGGRR